MMRKGQSAIEYLMNYAWAIALIIIVGAAIYGLNIGGIKNSLGGQGTQLQSSSTPVAVSGYQYNTTSFVVSMQNNGVNKINMTFVNVSTVDGATVSATAGCSHAAGASSAFLYPGDTRNGCVVSGLTSKTSGQPYTVKLVIHYIDNTTGILYSPTYTLSGSAV